MAFPVRSNDDIVGSFISNLRGSGVTFLPKGSKARAIADALGSELSVAYQFFQSNFNQAFLGSATGRNLDSIGRLFSLRRKEAKKALSLVSEENIVFYVDGGGTFGSINNGNDITIVAGTIIESRTGGVVSEPVSYQVISTTILSSASTIGYVGVEALVEGKEQNLGSNTLVSHNFTSYTNAGVGSLLVTNRFAIVNGIDRQTDSDYRYAISIAATALQASNALALQLSLLSVPGVIDFSINKYFDGIGTVGVFVAGQDNQTPTSMVAQAQAAIDRTSSAGEYVTAYAPPKVGLSFVTRVNTSEPLTADEKINMEEDLLVSIYNFFADQGIGQELDLEGLVRRMLAVDSRIVSFGTRPNKDFFDELYVYRASDTANQRRKTQLLAGRSKITSSLGVDFDGYKIEDHEIVIAETSLVQPFQFSFLSVTE